MNIVEIIANCPTSIPRLNENNGTVILFALPNNDLNNTEKPNPCIRPKKRAIKKWRKPLLFLSVFKVNML